MVKKSVSKAVNNVSQQLKSVFDTQNILSSIIIILLVVYMSFVNKSNVPQLFNNVIVKLVLLGLVAYTFFQDRLVAVFLAITVILSISLVSKAKDTGSGYIAEEDTESGYIAEEDDRTYIPSKVLPYEELPSEELPPILEKPSRVNLSVPSKINTNRYLNNGPTGVPSSGLNISTHSGV